MAKSRNVYPRGIEDRTIFMLKALRSQLSQLGTSMSGISKELDVPSESSFYVKLRKGTFNIKDMLLMSMKYPVLDWNAIIYAGMSAVEAGSLRAEDIPIVEDTPEEEESVSADVKAFLSRFPSLNSE